MFESRETEIKRKRQIQDRQNKKHIQKALKVLGHDPSEQKLEEKLGIEKEQIRRELRSMKSSQHSSYPFFMKAVAVGALVAAAIYVVQM